MIDWTWTISMRSLNHVCEYIEWAWYTVFGFRQGYEIKTSAMSKLPHELLVDILTCLPVKSLIRFKCVSKEWYFLISSSKFAKWHLRRGTQENKINRHIRLLLFTQHAPLSIDFEAASNVGNYKQLKYPTNIMFSRMTVLGSCNGLVCLNCFSHNRDVSMVVLWNPSTRVSKLLPSPRISMRGIDLSGLGYDERTDDYKLIVAGRRLVDDDEKVVVEVFTLKSHSWRTINHDFNFFFTKVRSGVYLNQSLYWIRWDRGNEYEIFTFDIAKEMFKKTWKLPNYCKKGRVLVNLAITSSNSLCVLCEYRDSISYLQAFVLDGFGTNATWNELFEVPYRSFGEFGYKSLCLTNKGEVIIYSYGSILGFYNPHEWSFGSFQLGDAGLVAYYGEPEVYFETLVSPYLFD